MGSWFVHNPRPQSLVHLKAFSEKVRSWPLSRPEGRVCRHLIRTWRAPRSVRQCYNGISTVSRELSRQRFPERERLSSCRRIHRIVSADEPGPCSRRLSREQRRALLEVRERVDPKGRPQEFLQDLVSLIGQNRSPRLRSLVRGQVLGGRGRVTAEPSIAVHAQRRGAPLDRMSATPGVRVEIWRTPDRDWTLVGLAGQPIHPSS